MKQMKNKSKILAMILLATAAIFISFFMGRYSLNPVEVILLLREKYFNIPSGLDSNASTVFFSIRGPRVVAAFLAGAGLSVSGCAYQGVFKNPIVSPDILGATAGAGLGAAIGLLLSLNSMGVQMLSFSFGLTAVLMTYLTSKAVGNRQNMALTLVLSGIVMEALFQSGISLIKYVADPYSKLPAITFWLMGSLSSVVPRDLPILLLPLLIGCIPLFLLRWKINLLSFSDEEAESMGIHTARLRLIIILCATFITSAVVAVGGIIQWVGLIIPHLARMIVGPDHKHLLPASILLGGAYLLLVDDVARSLTSMEIPLGILTSIIGAPFFIYLMYRGKNERS